jgi:hypothetical protein
MQNLTENIPNDIDKARFVLVFFYMFKRFYTPVNDD